MEISLLKSEREKQGWTQAYVASMLGVTVRTVSRWEQERALPYPCYRRRLCTLFDKQPEELGFPLLKVKNESARKKTIARKMQNNSPTPAIQITNVNAKQGEIHVLPQMLAQYLPLLSTMMYSDPMLKQSFKVRFEVTDQSERSCVVLATVTPDKE